MIDTEALRKKVIDLAIQGKLTEQLPSDGDAETLYAQIQEEKANLIKMGKIRKEKPLQNISKNNIPFDIPNNWKWVKLENIGYFISGYTPSNEELYFEGNIPYFKVSDMNSERNKVYLTYTSLYLQGDSSTKQFEKNTIVYPKNGGALLTNKKRILGQNSVVDLNTGGFMPVGKTDVNYAYLLFLNIDFQQYHKGSAVPTLDMIGMRNILIPLPPVEEQKRIVNVVDSAFESIDIIDDLQSKYSNDLTVLKSKIIDAGIQGKLTEQLPEDGNAEDLYAQILNQKSQLIKEGKIKKEKPLPVIAADEIPFEIPKNWKWVRLIDVSTVINGDRGKNYPAKSTLSREGIPFISALNLNGVGVDDDDRLMCLSDEQYNKLGSGKLQKDDIVICIRGSLGKHGRYPFEKGAIASSLVICRPHCYDNEMGGFIMKWLDSSMFPREIDKYDGGSAQPNLAAENLKKFLIPLPPIDEQRRIVEMIDSTISSMG